MVRMLCVLLSTLATSRISGETQGHPLSPPPTGNSHILYVYTSRLLTDFVFPESAWLMTYYISRQNIVKSEAKFTHFSIFSPYTHLQVTLNLYHWTKWGQRHFEDWISSGKSMFFKNKKQKSMLCLGLPVRYLMTSWDFPCDRIHVSHIWHPVVNINNAFWED